MLNNRTITLYLTPRANADLTRLLDEGFEKVNGSENPLIERRRKVKNQSVVERVGYFPEGFTHPKTPNSTYKATLYAAHLDPASSIDAQLSFWRTMEAYFFIDHAITRVV